MRSFVCGQRHVEYYFKGDGKPVTYPWANGVRVEEIEAYYTGTGTGVQLTLAGKGVDVELKQ